MGGGLECWSVGVLTCWESSDLLCFPHALDSPTQGGGVSLKIFATNPNPLRDLRALFGRTLNADPQTLNALLDCAAVG